MTRWLTKAINGITTTNFMVLHLCGFWSLITAVKFLIIKCLQSSVHQRVFITPYDSVMIVPACVAQ